MRAYGTGIGPAASRFTLTYQGIEIDAVAGDSIASALTAAGERVCRQTDDGDSRGVFCGMGVCSECSVVVDGRAGTLACLTPAREGLQVAVQPARPALTSPRTDLDAGTDRPEIVLAPDVLVVGGGPAGLTAAAIAAESGLEVVLVDERGKLGGQYYKQPAPGTRVDPDRIDRQFRDGRALVARFASSGARVLTSTRIWAAFARDHLVATGPDGPLVLRPAQLVLATGAYERGLPFPGWTLPGVITTGAAQTLLRSHQVSPGRRVLVAGNGPLNLQVAAELTRAGVPVVTVAELGSPFHPGRAAAVAAMMTASPALARLGAGYLTTLARHRVRLHQSTAVIRCDGDTMVRQATLARINRQGRPVPGTEQTLDVDAVCLGYGFLPSNELARSLGCEHRPAGADGALAVVKDDDGRTSVPGVWVIGDSAESLGAKVALAAGALCGSALVATFGRTVPNGAALAVRKAPAVRKARAVRKALRRHRRFQSALTAAYSAPALGMGLARPDTVVCRCEGVTLADLRGDLAAGVGQAGSLKRVTRAGMGKCQGRYCGSSLVQLAHDVAGDPPDAFAGLRPQAPARPTSVAAMAAPLPPSERSEVRP